MSESEETYEDAVFAGEYVLGVLDADERARAEMLLRNDQAFAEYVGFWENRLTPLAAEIDPVAPPAAIKRRIMTILFAEEPHKRTSPLTTALSFWRAAAAALAAIAIISSAALIFTTLQPKERLESQLIATVLPAGASPILQAQLDERLRVLQIENAAIELADNQVAELWLIPEDGTPRSLGLINSSGGDRVEIPQTLRNLFAAGAVLAVSLEPPGGSPTGAPTGPVIGLGQLDRK